jgi:hypothetical protein
VARPHLFEPGCGIGGGVTQVAAMLPQAKVTGLSLVEKQLEIGLAMSTARRLANTEFVRGNYLDTPFPAACFDGIFAIETQVYTPIAEKPVAARCSGSAGHLRLLRRRSPARPTDQKER